MAKKFSGTKLFKKKAMLLFSAKAVLLALLIYPFAGKYSLLSEKKSLSDPHKDKLIQVSQTMGHLLGKTVAELPINFELQEVIKGLQDSANGKTAPLSEEEWQEELKCMNEELMEKTLVETEQFFEDNHQDPDIQELVPGKLQFKTLQEGDGDAVQAYYRPLIRYNGYLNDGRHFLPTQEEAFQLDEAMPGLQQAICGMKKGEKRVIYIHPELTSIQNNPPIGNGIPLVFEVEVLDIDTKDGHVSPLEELISSENGDMRKEASQTK